MTIGVIAKTKQHFEAFLREIQYEDRLQFFYVSNHKAAQGRTFAALIHIGPWYERADAHELSGHAALRVRPPRTSPVMTSDYTRSSEKPLSRE